MRFLVYIFSIIFSGNCFAQAGGTKNDTIYPGYKGGNTAYAEQLKVNYLDFNKPEKGKHYKAYAEIILPEREINCPVASIASTSSKELTDDNKIWLCNALASGCDKWIYKTYNGKRYQGTLYYEISISADDVKVKSIKYSPKLGWFRRYEDNSNERSN